MRDLSSVIPPARQDDEFGQHACAAMLKISRVGYKRWLEDELAEPSWQDKDWCRMVVALSQGKLADFGDDPNQTYRCAKCKDTGLEFKPDFIRGRSRYQVTKWCDPCAWRMWARANWKQKQDAEGRPGRKSSLEDELLD